MLNNKRVGGLKNRIEGCLVCSSAEDRCQKSHADEKTVAHLSEVAGPQVEVDFWCDFSIARQWMHDDHGALGLGEQLQSINQYVEMLYSSIHDLRGCRRCMRP